MVCEALLAIECTFAFAARIGIGDETTVPPFSATIIKKMMNDAVAKGCGDDFANDGVMNDESDAATRFIKAAHNAIA